MVHVLPFLLHEVVEVSYEVVVFAVLHDLALLCQEFGLELQEKLLFLIDFFFLAKAEVETLIADVASIFAAIEDLICGRGPYFIALQQLAQDALPVILDFDEFAILDC